MNTHKVTQIQIGNGTSAMPTAASVISVAGVGSLGIYNNKMKALTAGDTISDADSFFVFNKLTSGDLKKSMEIKGRNVTSYKGQSYAPASREVWAIGYNRKLAAGDIAVSNSTLYNFSIRFKNDKTFYSERPEVLNVTFTSSASASQSNICDQIVSAINGSGFGTGPNKQILAVKIGDGTGAYGVTAATNFGVEIWGLDIPQFTASTYKQGIVYFSVAVDDSTGFDSTTECAQISAFDYGNGTYAQVYNQENFDLQYEGVLNRRLWPVPSQSLLASSSYFDSAAIVPTAATTIGLDKVTFSASVSTALTNIVAGDKVVIDGVNYEIKYMISSTVGILTTTATTTNATGAVKKRFQYDIINIEFMDTIVSPGANVGQFARKVLMIATPAIDAGGAVNSQSTEEAGLMAILNPYMASLNFPALSL